MGYWPEMLHGHKKDVNLARADALEMARSVANHADTGGSYIRFTMLDEAAACCPRVRALPMKLDATLNAFHSWLLKQVQT